MIRSSQLGQLASVTGLRILKRLAAKLANITKMHVFRSSLGSSNIEGVIGECKSILLLLFFKTKFPPPQLSGLLKNRVFNHAKFRLLKFLL